MQRDPGAHDDIVMAWLIGLHALLYGRNINKFVKLSPTIDYVEGNGEEIAYPVSRRNMYVKQLYQEPMPPGLGQLVEMETERRRKEILENSSSERTKRINKNIQQLLKK